MKTISKECIIEFEEKKSKFIGYIKPVNTCYEAEKFIKEIRNLHPTATHNCTAYRVLEEGQEYYKFDDDGEPSGTAGKPMGEILKKLAVHNVVVVATRYFGGIKLGAGGLIRNYAKTAKLAVLEGEIVEYIDKKIYLLDFPYTKVNEIDTHLENEKIIEKNYDSRITYKVEISEKTEKLLKNIKNLILVKL